MEVYDGVRNLWFSVISKPFVFGRGCSVFAWMHASMLQTIPSDCSCCGSVCPVNIYPACDDMRFPFGFHNIMVARPVGFRFRDVFMSALSA